MKKEEIPKYKIGDVVVVKDGNHYTQGKIVSAITEYPVVSIPTTKEIKAEKHKWYYFIEKGIPEPFKYLSVYESEILKKLE